MNVGLASAFLVLGLFFAGQVTVILGLFPVWVLAAFLVYAGLRHAWLVADLRGLDLAIACAAGVVGAWKGNLAYTVAIGLAYEAGRRVRRTRVGNSRVKEPVL
jgi:hypothetical protein